MPNNVANSNSARFLVTGAKGCIGSWVVKNLIESGEQPVVFDIDLASSRLDTILSKDQIDKIVFVQGDISDQKAVENAVRAHEISYIIHLAGLQVPICASDPVRGARVNVLGTLNVFEAAKRNKEHVLRVVYASSCAVFGPPEFYCGEKIRSDSPQFPQNHYGVFKQCNEGNARIYFRDDGISSVALRPWAVYGVGRDFGKSSGPSKAIKAAVVGARYTIPFTGGLDLHYVDDTAKLFILAAKSDLAGARAYSPRGAVIQIADFLEVLQEVLPQARGLIDARGATQEVAYDFDDSDLVRDLPSIPRTTLADGIRQTAEIFGRLKHENRLSVEDLSA